MAEKKAAAKPAAKKTTAKPAAKSKTPAKKAETKTTAKAKTASAKSAPAKTAAKKATAAKPKTTAAKKPAAKTTAKAPAKKTTTKTTTAKPKATAAKTKTNVKEPAKQESKNVVVHGYVEFQQPLPVVKVYENGNLIAKLKRLEKLVLGPIDKDTTLEFKTLFHKTSVTIPASDPKDVQLSYSTMTGKIKAILTDKVDDLQEELNHKDEKNRKVYIIACIAIAVLLFSISMITKCASNV